MAEEKCKHKWVDMEDGTLDQFCVRCSLKQMQNAMLMPKVPSISADIGFLGEHPLRGMVKDMVRESLEVQLKEAWRIRSFQ